MKSLRHRPDRPKRAGGRRAAYRMWSALGIAAVTLAACTSPPPDGRAVPASPSETSTSPAPAPELTEAPGPDSTAPSAGTLETPRSILCRSNEAHAVQPVERSADDIVVGPLGWPSARKWATGDPAEWSDPTTGYVKVGAELTAGATVTVAIAPEASAYAGLRYGQAWGYTPAQAVTFHACNRGDTAYIGGFHVDGPRCVPLDVTIGDAAPTRIVISFFNGVCPD